MFTPKPTYLLQCKFVSAILLIHSSLFFMQLPRRKPFLGAVLCHVNVKAGHLAQAAGERCFLPSAVTPNFAIKKRLQVSFFI